MTQGNGFPEEERINFHSESIDFELTGEEFISTWINKVIHSEKGRLIALNFIFCSDAYLHQINVEYLNHDTFTDVITFPYASPPDIEGDIFISVERVRENAQTYNVEFEQELRRVMIHGVLHLCGYSDKTPEEAARMREKEDEALLIN
jgi:probable rRNA maturation factor